MQTKKLNMQNHSKPTKKNRLIRRRLGYIAADAGLCWIGDPCYIIHSEIKKSALGESWSDFVNNFYYGKPPLVKKLDRDAVRFDFDDGNPGVGICVNTSGDWGFPVYGHYRKVGKHEILEKVSVDFMYAYD